MRNIVNEYIKIFEEDRRARRRTLGVILILALFVSVGVFWNLHFTGVALTGEVYFCGQEEHTHDESCYAWVLSDTSSTESEAAESTDAEAEEVLSSETISEDSTVETGEADVTAETTDADTAQETTEAAEVSSEHTQSDGTDSAEASQNAEETIEEESESSAADETAASDDETESLPSVVLVSEAIQSEEWYINNGYEKVLICGQEEHTHTLECISDAAADVETADDWEAALPEELNGTAAENLVAVAESQLGYTESTANFTLAEDGVTRKGYTRYGAWYGNAYGDWDTMFIAFCLHYAGIAEEDFPINSGAYAWAVQLAEAELYADADEYVPSAGDVIFLDTNADGKADQTGIVETLTVDPETADVTLTVILANVLDESESAEDTTAADTVCEAEYALDDETILGYGVLPDVEVNPPVNGPKTIAAVELEEQTLTVTTEDGVTVTLSGMLPVDATVSAEPVDAEVSGMKMRLALDICIYDADGNEFEPEDDTITVTIVSDDITENCIVYHLSEEGDPEEVSSEANEGTLTFDANHFSPYVIGEDLYDYYIAKIDELWDEAYALEDGDISGANDLSSDLGDLVDEAYACIETGDLTKDEYDLIYAYAETLWEYLDENFDPNRAISLTADNVWTYLDELVEDGENPADDKYLYNVYATGTNSINTNVTLSGNLKNGLVYYESKLDGDVYTDDTQKDRYLILLNVEYYADQENKSVREYLETNPTMEKCGTITISEAFTIDGESFDLVINVDSIYLESYAEFWENNSSLATGQESGLKDGYLCIGYIEPSNDNEKMQILAFGMAYGENDRSTAFPASGYSYPGIVTTTISTYAVKSGDTLNAAKNNYLDQSFLVVAADLDVYKADNTSGDDAGENFSETFQTFDGFTSQFYKYSNCKLNITNQELGEITAAQVPKIGSQSGRDSYTVTGVYGVTESGYWKTSYTDGYCGTQMSVYCHYNTLTLKKVSSADQSTPLKNVSFYLYKYKNGDKTTKYYYTGVDSTSGFGLYSSDFDDAKSLTTLSNGSVEIPGLSAGTYYLTEIKTIDGYSLLDTDVYFTVTSLGTISVPSGQDSVVSSATSHYGELVLTVQNTPAYDITVVKVSSVDDSITLDDVTFVLSRTVDGKTTYYTYSTDSNENGIVTWVESEDDAKEFTSGSDGPETGAFTIKGLEAGTYTLTEKTAADGYKLLTEEIEFSITNAGGVNVVSGVDYASFDTSTDTIILTVKNDPGYELPFTGGTGTTVFTCFGLLLITSAVWFIYMKQRQRKSQIASGT